MRYLHILQTIFEENLRGVHLRRQAAVLRAVAGLITGGQLWLTALGRSLPGTTSDKHRIKAADRLLGNAALHCEIGAFYRAVASRLLRRTRHPVIAVDWTGLGPEQWELSAKLCCDGRPLALYSRVYSEPKLATRAAHRRFLRELADVLPPGCVPILVTDAGFRTDWFRDVARAGWHYVGRARGNVKVIERGKRVPIQALFRRATRKPKNLGVMLLPANDPEPNRLVLSKRPQPVKRHRLTRSGKPGKGSVDCDASKAAREPWLLVTSLRCRASYVVRVYSTRTQIEQAFRDRKNYRHGWHLRLAATRSLDRMHVLLLIASLAEIVVQLAGRAVAGTTAAYQFQANTVRKRRVLSFFFLGQRVIRTALCVSWARLLASFRATLGIIEANAADLVPE